jgi:hypothetical protein
MSFSSDPSSQLNQLSFSREFPEDPKLLKNTLLDNNQKIANAVNSKIGGFYTTIEKGTSEQYIDFNNTQNTRNIYRVLVDFGQLPNAGSTQIAHGINGWNARYDLVRCYGAANSTSLAQSIPLSNDGISITINATDVTITTTADFSAYDRATVVIEYIRG